MLAMTGPQLGEYRAPISQRLANGLQTNGLRPGVTQDDQSDAGSQESPAQPHDAASVDTSCHPRVDTRNQPSAGRVERCAPPSSRTRPWSRRGHGPPSIDWHRVELDGRRIQRLPCSDPSCGTRWHRASRVRREFESPPGWRLAKNSAQSAFFYRSIYRTVRQAGNWHGTRRHYHAAFALRGCSRHQASLRNTATRPLRMSSGEGGSGDAVSRNSSHNQADTRRYDGWSTDTELVWNQG